VRCGMELVRRHRQIKSTRRFGGQGAVEARMIWTQRLTAIAKRQKIKMTRSFSTGNQTQLDFPKDFKMNETRIAVEKLL